jgi:hypothetical protein
MALPFKITAQPAGTQKAYEHMVQFYGKKEGERIFLKKAEEQGSGNTIRQKCNSIYKKGRTLASRTPLPVPRREILVDLFFNQGYTYKMIASEFGASAPTVCKWFKDYKIDASRKFAVVEINGVPHKRCVGPSHAKGGELVRLDKFHKNAAKKDGVTNRCVACTTGNQMVKFAQYKPWVESIYRRLGFKETTRRLEINDWTLTQWLGKNVKHPSPQKIQRQSAIKIATLMLELRVTGEVRHRKSIRRGSALRGEIEREVSTSRDLYKPHGDQYTEQARERRRSLGSKEVA